MTITTEPSTGPGTVIGVVRQYAKGVPFMNGKTVRTIYLKGEDGLWVGGTQGLAETRQPWSAIVGDVALSELVNVELIAIPADADQLAYAWQAGAQVILDEMIQRGAISLAMELQRSLDDGTISNPYKRAGR